MAKRIGDAIRTAALITATVALMLPVVLGFHWRQVSDDPTGWFIKTREK
jgi:hypothetical protein